MTGLLRSTVCLVIGTLVSMALFLGMQLYALAPDPDVDDPLFSRAAPVQFVDIEQVIEQDVVFTNLCGQGCIDLAWTCTLPALEISEHIWPTPVSNHSGLNILAAQALLVSKLEQERQIQSQLAVSTCARIGEITEINENPNQVLTCHD